MARLNILVGIGLMLVGSLAYALPTVQDLSVLYTAFGGIVIATGGFITLNHESLRNRITYMNAGVAMMIIVWASFRAVPDAYAGGISGIPFVADLDAILLCAIPVFLTVRSFIESRLRIEQERNALWILDRK